MSQLFMDKIPQKQEWLFEHSHKPTEKDLLDPLDIVTSNVDDDSVFKQRGVALLLTINTGTPRKLTR